MLELHDLHGYDERYRDEVVVQNDEGEDVLDELLDLVASVFESNIPHLVAVRELESDSVSGAAEILHQVKPLTVRTKFPIEEPTDSRSRMAKRKRIWVLTILSTAVRLIGVALKRGRVSAIVHW